MAEYRLATQSLVTLAQRDLTAFWQSLNVQGDPTRVRDAVLEFFPELVALYGEPSAVLGADWYDMLRDVPPSSSSFRAVAASPVEAEQSVASARWGLGPLFDGDPGGALALLTGVTQRLVMQPYRDTVFLSAYSDPVRTGVARVPSGSTTCRFCVMLASRGAVYKSEVNAELVVGRGSNRTGYDAAGKRLSGGIGGGVKPRGNMPLGARFHDHCDCATVVVRSESDYPDGFDLSAMKRLYAEQSGIGRDAPINS